MTTMIDVNNPRHYPFCKEATSFVLHEGVAVTLNNRAWDDAERAPVLAIGSNRSLQQLVRKYPPRQGWGEIPVVKATLNNFDVVYSAHVAQRGYIPATLAVYSGTRVEIAITWLATAIIPERGMSQLDRMHSTEGRGTSYDFWRLSNVELAVDAGPTPPEIYAYISRYGALLHNTELLPLADVNSSGRSAKAYSETEVLLLARDRLGLQHVPEPDFIAQHTGQAAGPSRIRQDRIRALAVGARPFSYPFGTIV